MNLSSLRLIDGIAVTGIIGIVGALVFPVIGDTSTSHDQQAQETCISNLKQLGLASVQYIQDYDQVFPSGADWNGSGSGWAQQLYPYYRTMTILKCPLDSDPHDVISYGYNSNLVRVSGYHPSAPVGLPMRVTSSPADTVAFFEVSGNGSQSPGGYSLEGGSNTDIHQTRGKFAPVDGWSPAGHGTGDGPQELTGMGDDAKPGTTPLQYATGHMQGSSDKAKYFLPGDGRHGGRSMFALADGHVRSMAPNEVSAGLNSNLATNCGGAGKAANTACVGQNGLTATFSAF